MILAVTEMDSGRDRVGKLVGTPPEVKASSLFLTEPDLSRGLMVSGDDSGEFDGEFLVNEFALSAIDGDLPRTLPFRTEKKAGDDPGGGPVVPVGVAAGAKLCNFSSALILCEMPEPRLTFLARGLLGC